ncbi:ABC transporter permease [Herbiconiux ginsengi]|uniref:Xylose transport system permease protein XylH n=1 Tax=Herbiconiux ginsengi TaxID=381665 RepID=A0A1H3MXL6_9MICO|nr:ABC transporter permease [Herbiconiux ginsengi]SDY81254.1 monosaccharide ABC transporter membrane protein, CUT2 family [Herbiconiux ginsengi]
MTDTPIAHVNTARRSSLAGAFVPTKIYRSPQFGALIAAVGVYVFFAVVAGPNGFLTPAATAGWVNATAELALIAIPVGVLMISGEFDLSVGSVVGASSITVALGSTVLGLPLPLVIIAALGVGALTGLVNGLIVNATRLPSFIVTLASNFILLGLALGLSRVLAGVSTVSVTFDEPWSTLFASTFFDLNVTVVWCLVVGLVAYWVLAHTRMGSWIYATGGNLDGAIKAGVPTNRVRLTLFIASGLGAALVGVLQAGLYHSGNAVQGQGFVFQAPIVAVIGGVLLVGGYGSVQGIVLGAITYGVVSIGLFYTGWTSDWLSAFIGGLLIIAVLANDAIRKSALKSGGRTRAPRARTKEGL